MYPVQGWRDLVGVCLIGLPMLFVALASVVLITSLFGVVWR